MFKRIATWIHLASGGGVQPEIYVKRNAPQPLILFAIYRDNGDGFRLTVSDCPPEAIYIKEACEEALRAVFVKNKWWLK
jgi:hypothetical protein